MPNHQQVIEITTALDAAAPLLWTRFSGKDINTWKTLPREEQLHWMKDVEPILIAAYPHLVGPFLRKQIKEVAAGLLLSMADHLQEQQRDEANEMEQGFVNGVTATIEYLLGIATSINTVEPMPEQTP